MGQQGTIYLIHFDDKVSDHAQHYAGWTSDLVSRLDSHSKGTGAALMAEVARLGLSWTLARTWSGCRDDERKLKKMRNLPRYCPVCHGIAPIQGHINAETIESRSLSQRKVSCPLPKQSQASSP